MNMIYLDWAATAKPDEDIYLDSQKKALEFWGNPSSLHEKGKEARYEMENLRSKSAEQLNCRPDQLILTSGGTESNNLAILSLLNRQNQGEIILSAIEHPSVSEPVKALSKFGFKIRILSPDNRGIFQKESLLKRLNSDTRMICIMAVHNTTGVIEPIKELVDCVREFEQGKRPIHFHCDMVQAVGKIPVDLKQCGVDSASFSGHKIGAPRGAGFLYLKSPQPTFQYGGGQEQGMRSGTESLQNMAALYLALEKYADTEDLYGKKIEELSAYLTERLIEDFPQIQFNPPARMENPELYVPAIINFSLPPLPGEVLHRILDIQGIALSHGSACAANGRKKPEDLHAMGIHPKRAHCSVRVSMGPETQKEDLDHFLRILKEETLKFLP